MAQIKTMNLIATILCETPKTAEAISQQSGVHIRSVYRYINWIDQMSMTFKHKLQITVISGSRYYHLKPFE